MAKLIDKTERVTVPTIPDFVASVVRPTVFVIVKLLVVPVEVPMSVP